jgi:hypothetical protein
MLFRLKVIFIDFDLLDAQVKSLARLYLQVHRWSCWRFYWRVRRCRHEFHEAIALQGHFLGFLAGAALLLVLQSSQVAVGLTLNGLSAVLPRTWVHIETGGTLPPALFGSLLFRDFNFPFRVILHHHGSFDQFKWLTRIPGEVNSQLLVVLGL